MTTLTVNHPVVTVMISHSLAAVIRSASRTLLYIFALISFAILGHLLTSLNQESVQINSVENCPRFEHEMYRPHIYFVGIYTLVIMLHAMFSHIWNIPVAPARSQVKSRETTPVESKTLYDYYEVVATPKKSQEKSQEKSLV